MKKCRILLLLILSVCTLIVSADCSIVYASQSEITVNNYVTAQEKAFTAEDLKRILDNSLSVNETDNVSEEDNLNKNQNNIEQKNDSVITDNAGKSDNSKDGKKDTESLPEESDIKGLYVPPKGEEWLLLLVNKQNPIPDDYAPELTDVNGSIKIRREIAYPLSEMFDAAEEDGVSLMVCSAYRSHEYQQGLFNRKIRNYTGKGLSYLDAFRIGSYSVIIPGTSEHELGMALDIVTPGYMNLNEGFAYTKAGKWLEANAYKYGFILRYPKGKEYITGIIFEPWHYRYVGREAARAITESGLTLEEYVEEIGYY